MNAREYILNFFGAKATLPTTAAELNQYNYLEVGLLDSFGIVKLIRDIEERFSIRFNHQQMTSNEFRTVGGLITLVESQIKGRGP